MITIFDVGMPAEYSILLALVLMQYVPFMMQQWKTVMLFLGMVVLEMLLSTTQRCCDRLYGGRHVQNLIRYYLKTDDGVIWFVWTGGADTRSH